MVVTPLTISARHHEPGFPVSDFPVSIETCLKRDSDKILELLQASR